MNLGAGKENQEREENGGQTWEKYDDNDYNLQAKLHFFRNNFLLTFKWNEREQELLFRGILFFSKAWWTSDWLVQNLVLLSREKECIHHFFDLWQSTLSLIANLWFKGTRVPDSDNNFLWFRELKILFGCSSSINRSW